MTIINDFNKRKAQTDQQALFATAASICAETEVLCRAKGLLVEADVIKGAYGNLLSLANGAHVDMNKFGSTYEETWQKMSQVLNVAAKYALELGKEKTTESLQSASDLFARMPEIMREAQKKNKDR